MNSRLSVQELKDMLRGMKLSTQGLKVELVNRLIEAGVTDEELRLIPLAEREVQNEQEETETRHDISVTDGGPAVQRTSELDLLRRENALAEREIRLLRRELELMQFSPREEGNHAPTLTSNSRWQNLKDLIGEYDGSNYDFDIWEKQMRQLVESHSLDESTAKALLCSKLKGKALRWYHARSDCVELLFNQMLVELRKMFGQRRSEVILRREFEARIWQVDESFTDYLHDKVILANKIPVPVTDSALVDYVIDGIPNETFQAQARISCFETTDALLRAFANTSLPKEATQRRSVKPQENTIDTKKIVKTPQGQKEGRPPRCFNCFEAGHYAKSCTKPKRERGSCFTCGKFGHQAGQCGKPTTSSSDVHYVGIPLEDNDFERTVNLSFKDDESKVSVSMHALLDSGSPISFIKESCLKGNKVTLDSSKVKFCGVNKSELQVLGCVSVIITLDYRESEINLRVVADETMSKPLVLGRDFLKVANLTICESEIREIMNIEVNDTDVESKERSMILNEDLPIEVKERAREIFKKCYVLPERPANPKVENVMKLTLLDEKPFHCTPRRLSHIEKIKLKEILDDLLEKGVIRESASEYASPIVLLKKRNGEFRMCIDFRVLNKVTARDNFPLPLIEDQLNVLAGKKYFTSLDLKDGFFHIRMHEDSVKYTSFVTPLGQYEYLKMPFGLKGAPLKFQRYVTKIFKELIEAGDVSVYLDDFLIATSTAEHHNKILEKVLTLLVENKLDLRLDKCKFFQTKLEYLGYTISSEGISPTERGIEAVKKFPIPVSLRDVQSFLGLCSYFRKFIESFSIIAKPLYDLMKKNVDFTFGLEESQAYEKLKLALVRSPILSIYSPHDETELHCDASALGYGAILLQRKSDHKFHSVFYFSKRTTSTESKYHSFELETLAIIYALRRFRTYLLGIKFKIITDCQALSLTLNKKETNPRISRWALEMQNFDYTLEHRVSSRMTHVDALSRQILVIEDNSFDRNLALCQDEDENIVKVRKQLEESESKFYELRNGLVYRKLNDQLLFYVPCVLENSVINKYHNEMGHVGAEKVIRNIMYGYWFPGMSQKVRNHIKTCLKCIAFSPISGKHEGALHSIPKGNAPFLTIHIDHLGPLSKSHSAKKRYIFLIVDAFTKFIKLYATKTTNTSEAIKCLKLYFSSYSRPLRIISDRGSCFTSREFEEFNKEYNIQHLKVATASPQANGQAERMNRTILPMISKLSDERRVPWYSVLDDVEFACNNTVNRSTGETPSTLLFGMSQRGNVIDGLREMLETQEFTCNRKDLETIRAKADGHIKDSQRKNETATDKKRKLATKYIVGDKVMIRNFENTPGICAKLVPQFKGPYEVARVLRNDRYVIRDIDGFQLTQMPYQGTWEAANMRKWTPV